MIKTLLLLAGFALGACGSEGRPDRNMVSIAAKPSSDTATTQCDPPSALVATGDAKFRKAFAPGSTLLEQTRESITQAFARSCASGVHKREPVHKVGDFDSSKLALVNAPEANVASIMWRAENESARLVLEYPFLTSDGQAHVPSADELAESIYCAVVGATSKEQEETGRCLPD